MIRLLRLGARDELTLETFGDDQIPPQYAILSHTWGKAGDEVTFKDLQGRVGKSKAGYNKIRFCGKQAQQDGLEYFWVDTCCIDKSNAVELSEAINSMFGWYRKAVKCYVYLSDVSFRKTKRKRTRTQQQTWESSFSQSRWFTRGWTLQELIAPTSVEFFSIEGERLGDKKTLAPQIYRITNIPIKALHGASLLDFSVKERRRWAEKRNTTKKEDKAYCLLGIFDVFMVPIYGEGEENAFNRLNDEIEKRSKTSLDEVYAKVRNHYLHGNCLTIERLSGQTLPMNCCFVNLGIVQHLRDGDRKKTEGKSDGNSSSHLSEFSLAARLKVETPPETQQVTLETLFKPRERPDKTTARPNRILIWGRAGIGKTTLCKKIVHDIIHDSLWSELFDCVYWLPLRRLKLMKSVPTNIGQVIQFEYLGDAGDGLPLAEVIQKGLANHGDRTLFILDGLDEVSYAWDPDTPMGRILTRLLEQDNVIITSRPHSTYVLDHTSLDLELETIGFFPEQVEKYLQSQHSQPGLSEKTVSEIRSFIHNHPLVQSLARIPIQLDAMCYAWSAGNFPQDNVTMTTLYQAITQQLWAKDIVRLEKKMEGERLTKAQLRDFPGSKCFVETESALLEALAFNGLYNENVEFNAKHFDEVSRGQKPILGDRPVHLSFLRSSDTSLQPAKQTFHFIHLTFQEFFAAQYFVSKWLCDEERSLVVMNQEGTRRAKPKRILPEDFLSIEKYSARYDIFWRFVVGLLHNEDDSSHLHRFFDVLEGKTRDLLGPTHQRLVIHCLSEIDATDESFQSRFVKLEHDYWQWILFEHKYNSSTSLMREAECPDRIFAPWIRGSTDDVIRVISTLTNRPNISSEILDVIVRLLQHADSNVRLRAADALGRQSNLSEPVLVVLVQLLEDPEADVRSRAAYTLGRQFNPSEPVLAALVQLLKDPEPDVRLSAAYALGGQSNLSEPVLAALVQLLKDPEPGVQSRAADTLYRQSNLSEPVLAALVQLLKDPEPGVQSRAVYALGGQSNLSEPVLAALVQLLKDPEPDVRSSAADALGGRSNLSEPVLAALVQLLKDPEAGVRSRAVYALGGQSNLSEPVLAALVQLLKDPEAGVRSRAVYALGGQSNLSEPVLAALVQLLKDPEAGVRSSAAYTLGRQFNPSEPVLAALVQLLEDPEPGVRLSAAYALGGQSNLSEPVLAALVQLLKDPEPDVRLRAADALGGQSNLSEPVLAALVQLLKDPEPGVGPSAAKVLQMFDNFYTLIPDLYSSSLQVLLQFWHKRSFDHSITCFTSSNTLYIDVDGKMRRIHLEEAQQEAINHACLEIRKATGAPPPTAFHEFMDINGTES